MEQEENIKKTVITNEQTDDTAYYQCERSPVAVIRYKGMYRGVLGDAMFEPVFETQKDAIEYFEGTVDWPVLRNWMHYEINELHELINELYGMIDNLNLKE